MPMNTRVAGLTFVKVMAVGLALAVSGYLVVSAQRRANPEPLTQPESVPSGAGSAGEGRDASAGTTAAAAVTSESIAVEQEFMSSSKSKVLDPRDLRPPDSAEFLMGSKSGVLTTVTPNGTPESVVPGATTSPTEPAEQRVFLPTSKSAGPILEHARAEEPPVYLPSSKVLTIRDAVHPAPKPATTPNPAPVPPPSKPKDR